jgi:hypothetical protein
MRSLALVVIILSGTLPAMAYSSNTGRIATSLYSACSCRFGYGGGICTPDVACLSEGGRFERSCAPVPGNDPETE